jgi:trimeric autotransporter adhesin
MSAFRLCLSILFCSGAGVAQQYVISTYAGGAPPPTPAMGTVASIGRPASVAMDTAGNVYLSSDNCVFRLDQRGILTRVAGNSRGGYSGDGGPATNAQLQNPQGVAVDSSGNLYVADLGNNRVRKVTPAGTISTVAGGGAFGVGDGGPATSAKVPYPSGVAVDTAGNLYIADYGDSRIRKVTPAGIISTAAGTGTAGYSGDGGPAISRQLFSPSGVAVDNAGNLYITDWGNSRVRKVTPTGDISTVAGNGAEGYSGDGGPATSAELHLPIGVAVDNSGNLYVADNQNNRIRKVTPTGIISTIAGTGSQGYSGDGGPATSAQLNFPNGVAADNSGNLYIADYGNDRVRKVTPAGIISTVTGNGTAGYSGDGGPATSAQLYVPNSVAVDNSGNLYITDYGNGRVRKVTPAGIISTIAGNGTSGYSGDGGPATSAQFYSTDGVVVDNSGNLYIADVGNNRVRKVTPAGIISAIAGNGTFGYSGDGGPATSAQLNAPNALAVDNSGNLYITDNGNSRVRKVTPAGIISTVAGNGSQGYSGDGGPATSAQLLQPRGVTVDKSGNLYIADSFNGRIRKVTPAGIISTVAGNGSKGYSGDGGPAISAQLYLPNSVAVDNSGNLYMSDYGNSGVRKVTPAGIISTIAGNGTAGYSGDGGPATSAQLTSPNGVAVDSAGNLYIADLDNDSIRLVRPQSSPSAPTLLTGGIVPAYSSVNTIEAGEWISLYGSNLASSMAAWNGAFTTSLGGTSVTIDGKAAYLSYVSPDQINVQAPDDTATGSVPVVVTTASGSVTGTVTLAAFAPSFLLLDGKHVAGIIVRPNGSGAYGGGSYDIIGPTGTSVGYATVAAQAGDAIELFAVGLGPTHPPVPAGQPSTGAAPTTNAVNVLINNVSVTPAFAGLSGAGLYQLNLTVPVGLGAGDVPIEALVGGAQTQSGVVLSLR